MTELVFLSYTGRVAAAGLAKFGGVEYFCSFYFVIHYSVFDIRHSEWCETSELGIVTQPGESAPTFARVALAQPVIPLFNDLIAQGHEALIAQVVYGLAGRCFG